jgi:hypothetical protein
MPEVIVDATVGFGAPRMRGGFSHGGAPRHRIFRHRHRGRFGRPAWWWGPEIVIVQDTRPLCVWRETGAVPAYVFSALASVSATMLEDGTSWKQVHTGGRWWAEHRGASGSAYYWCDFSDSTLAGLGAQGESAMKANVEVAGVAGVGAVFRGGQQAPSTQQFGQPVNALMLAGEGRNITVWIKVGNSPPAPVQMIDDNVYPPPPTRIADGADPGLPYLWDKGWGFSGQGYMTDDGRLFAIGIYKIGQHTNIGRGSLRAHTVQQTSTFAPSAPSGGASTFTALRGLEGEGLGILGNPNLKEKVPAGTYEITGTQVALRATPNGSELGRFNNKYGANNDKVVEPVDTVDATGEVGYNVAGHNWARVKVLSGELSGKEGFVATDFLGEIGFTKAHGGTGPAPSGPLPSKDLEQVSVEEPEKKTSYTVPLIVGGLALTGLIVGLAMMKKKKHRPAMAHEARRRRRRIRRRVRHPRGYG